MGKRVNCIDFSEISFSFWSHAYLKQDSYLYSKNMEQQMESFNQQTNGTRFHIFFWLSYDVGQVWMGAGQLLLTPSPCRIDAGGLGVSDTSRDVFEKN